MSQPQTEAENICLFGGTFDPIHLGHTHIAQAAAKQLKLDRVIFLPCQQSPHKLGTQHAAAKQRLRMCQLATAELSWAEVDDFDLVSAPPSYSWRTAEAMAARFPDARLYWLMGTDQWSALPRWNQPEKLTQLVEFIVFCRGEAPAPREGYRMHSIDGDHPASATSIRQAPQQASSQSWLHPDVANYIDTHLLYQ